MRWYSEGQCYDTLTLEVERTAFMVVDADGGASGREVEEGIAPALAAARRWACECSSSTMTIR